MATLTEKRLKAAKPTLESYRKRLHDAGKMDARQFEAELRQAWEMGYGPTWKTIVIDMAKNHPRYKYVAAYYIENEHPTGVSAHYRSVLTKLYGTRGLTAEKREAKRAAFWKRIAKK
jgi:hypothetical protein